MVQGEESLAALEREAERLDGGDEQAHDELEQLGVQSGAVAADASSRRRRRLKRLEERDCDVARELAGQAGGRSSARSAGEPTARRAGRGCAGGAIR